MRDIPDIKWNGMQLYNHQQGYYFNIDAGALKKGSVK